MNTLITTDEAKTLGRPIGDVKEGKIHAYIAEVEQTQIKPALGDALFRDILNGDNLDEEPFCTLLNGGEYEDKCGNFHSISGLKITIAYFVYVKVLMSGDIESTRFGMMVKNDQYSQHISSAARSAAYSEATEVAKHYLAECVAYCKEKELIVRPKKGASVGGCVIRKIG